MAITSSHCSNCGRRLTNPASIQRGIGPVCAAKEGISAFTNPKYRSMFNWSCICPFCGGTIELVYLNEWKTVWQWTCGGISGDGCHSDWGHNTDAPFGKVDRGFLDKYKPNWRQQYMNERTFHRTVAERTYALLGIRAVPPYPGPERSILASFSSSNEEKEQRKKEIMRIVNDVWHELHSKGFYGRYCQFYDPEMEHCSKCGRPIKRTTMENGSEGPLCRDCFKNEYPHFAERIGEEV